MAEMPAPTAPLGAPGERCTQCGAPLVPDQRYCLACGTRRAEARLAFREHLAAPPAAPAGCGPAEAPPRAIASDGDRARANLALVAGIGCLLLALGVGILIGRAGETPQRGSQAPQVISVGSSGEPAATTRSATTGAAAGAARKAATTKGRRARAKAATAKRSQATSKALQDLQDSSPKDYQKKSLKLPKTVGTGGKAPPVDKSKPAGAGSAVEEIG